MKMRNDIIVISCLCMAFVLVILQGADADEIPIIVHVILIVLTGLITGFITWAVRLPTDKGEHGAEWAQVLVHKTGSCRKVFIPSDICTVYVQNAKEEDIEISQVGDDVCVEVLDTKRMKCMRCGVRLSDGKKVVKK